MLRVMTLYNLKHGFFAPTPDITMVPATTPPALLFVNPEKKDEKKYSVNRYRLNYQKPTNRKQIDVNLSSTQNMKCN